MAKALGIPNRQNYGDLNKLQAGELLDYFLQLHEADRAGKHHDLRFGDEDRGLYSWAVPKGLPEPNNTVLTIQQPIHDHSYGPFTGQIHERYGKGTVHRADKGKVLITDLEPGKIHFTVAHKKHPERFLLIKTKGENKDWFLLNITPTDVIPHDKIKFGVVKQDELETIIENLENGGSLQAKVDGASGLLQLLENKAELASYRISKVNNRPIYHTERFFGKQPKLDIPNQFKGSVLMGEVFGEQNNKVLEPAEISGLLNSSVENSLRKQIEDNIKMKMMLYDIKRVRQTDIDIHKIPYSERRRLLEQIVKHLPDNFFVAPQAKTKEEGKNLLNRILDNKHNLTREGLVYHPPLGKPSKFKTVREHDVYVTGTFPAKPGSKYENKAVGGLMYALDPEGETIGRVGSGINDALREALYGDHDDYLGRRIRIKAQDKLPSGAYRMPVFIAFHEDYPNKSNQ